MSVTSATTAAPKVSTSVEAAQAVRVPQKVLGQSDFLKLITVQLQQQDPLKPMEDTTFIAQMAQFTALEQSTQLTREFARLRTDASVSGATSLLGRQVTVSNGDRDPVTGVVSAVDTSDGAPDLVINGDRYAYANLLKVQPAPVAPANGNG